MDNYETQISLFDADPPEFLSKLESKMSMFKTITLNINTFFYNIKCFFNDIRYGVSNLIYYFPVIWRDRPWDFEFMLPLLEAQLTRFKNNIGKNKTIVDYKEVCEQIGETIEHMHNYSNSMEVYELNNQELLNQIRCELNQEVKSNLVKSYIKGEYNYEQQEWKNIWNTIREYGQKWWD